MNVEVMSRTVVETVSVSAAHPAPPLVAAEAADSTPVIEHFTDEEVNTIKESLTSGNVSDFASCLLENDKVLRALRQGIISAREKSKEKEGLAVISVEQDTQSMTLTKEQGEKQIDLADMITKDGKLKKRKAKKQLSPEEIREKLRKLRESRDDIPMKTCDICGYRTREPYKMRRHERTHTGEKPFKCPLCPFRGAEKSVVVKHLKSNVHSKKSHQLGMRTGMAGMGIRIDCDQCSFTASSSQQMIKHKQTRHEGSVRRVGKLQCPYCEYRNSYQKVMDLHIKAHEEEGTNVPVTDRKPVASSAGSTSSVAGAGDDADDDGVVTVFLEDFISTTKLASGSQDASQVSASTADDGVEELLTSMNAS